MDWLLSCIVTKTLKFALFIRFMLKALSFLFLQQFDGDGNLLHKIDTRLSASSYGEDELLSLNQSYDYFSS